MIAFAADFPHGPRRCRRVPMPVVLHHPVTSLLDAWQEARRPAPQLPAYVPLTPAELAQVAAAIALAEQVRATAERMAHARRQALRDAHLAATARRQAAQPPWSLRRWLIGLCARLAAWLAAPIV